MSRVLGVLICIAVLLSVNDGFASQKLDYVDGVLLIRFLDDVTPVINQQGIVEVDQPEIDHLMKRFGASSFEPFFGTMIIKGEDYAYLTRNDYKIFFPPETDMYLVSEEFQQVSGIEWALPDLLLPMDYIPDDPSFGTQWFHEFIESSAAWDVVTGDEEIIVGAIDSGFDWIHPDLYDNVWVNPGEDLDDNHDPDDEVFRGVPGTLGDWNFADDDGNGLEDDFIGWDWVTVGGNGVYPGEDPGPSDNNPMDFGGHGTGCNSAMAEVGDNAIGAAGVAFNCKIMGLRAGYSPADGGIGVVVTSAAINAMAYATDKGISVINLSYGGGPAYEPMRNATEYAWENGVLMFGAAGNDNVGNEHYPANYEHVIAVAALNQGGNKAGFSNYGNWVDIAAPGVACYTAWCYGERNGDAIHGYQSWDGTSVASPIAAGIGALVINAYPQFTNEEWRQFVEDSTVPWEEPPPQPIGSGAVNAHRAVTMFNSPSLVINSIVLSDPDGNGHPDPGEAIDVVVSISNEDGYEMAENVIAHLSFDAEGLILAPEDAFVTGFLMPGDTVDNTGQPLGFIVPDDFPDGSFVRMTVTVTADPNDHEVGESMRVLIGNAPWYVIDDDGGADYEEFLVDDLEQLELPYEVYNVELMGEPDADELILHDHLLWLTGDMINPLSDGEISAIEGALDGGVDLFIAGQTLDDQLQGTEFYSDYLHAQHTGIGGMNLMAPAPDAAIPPAIPGSNLILQGFGGASNSTNPDVIQPINGALPLYSYQGGDNVGAIAYEGDGYKIAYFACAFEAISGAAGSTPRTVVLGGDETNDGIFQWFQAAGNPDVTMTLPLQGNYFELVSSYAVPPALDAAAVFGTIGSLDIVYQDDGSIYIPPDINTIGDITLSEGYQVYCSQDDQLEITGSLLNPATEYTAQANQWNWIGYPYNVEVPLETALSEILDEIQIVMTDDGGVYIPPFINTIGNMTPGVGYFMFVYNPVTFTYNNAALASAEQIGFTQMPEVAGTPSPTGLPYAVLVTLSDDFQNGEAGIIEIYDGDLPVGKTAVLENGITPVIAWGGNSEHDIPGFVSGHPITVQVRNAKDQVMGSVTSGTFGAGAYADIHLDISNLVPSEFTVEAAYPNPFNPSVSIPFALPVSGEVTFRVFNILGQELFSQRKVYEAGHHQYLFEASSSDRDLVSGMYFLQVSFRDQVSTQKVMLLK